MNRISKIEKVSISSINAFISDKNKWICENIFGCKSSLDQRNPYFWRGSILEEEVQNYSTNSLLSNEESLERATSKYDKFVNDNYRFLEYSQLLDIAYKQRDFIVNSIKNEIVRSAALAMGKIIKYQQPLARVISSTSFRLTGIADFITKDSIYEMKTKSNIYQISSNHIRQVIYYNYLRGLEPRLLYISDKEYRIWSVKSQLIKPYMFQIFDAVSEIEKIINMSIEEISKIYKSSLNKSLLEEANYKNVALELWG